MNSIRALMDNLNIDAGLSAVDFVLMDDGLPEVEIMTDGEINRRFRDELKQKDSSSSGSSDVSIPQACPVKISEAIDCAKKLRNFFERSGETTTNCVSHLSAINII